MTNLTKQQCETLDQILNSFDSNGYLKGAYFQKSFNNEKIASGYIDVLVSNRLVLKMGEIEGSDVPYALLMEPKAGLFIQNGGFSQLYEEVEKESALKKLNEENLNLQNENLNYLKTIREQEQRIRNFDEQNKLLEVIKNYWWLFAGIYAIGIATSKLLQNEHVQAMINRLLE